MDLRFQMSNFPGLSEFPVVVLEQPPETNGQQKRRAPWSPGCATASPRRDGSDRGSWSVRLRSTKFHGLDRCSLSSLSDIYKCAAGFVHDDV
jgi:hypothetical protein